MITPEAALAGREAPMEVPPAHAVTGNPMVEPFPQGYETAVFGLGCFWGAERVFWQTPGVYSTAVGYAGGFTKNPTYEETCSGQTGHTEAVLVVFNPEEISYESLVGVFYENHDPTQGMRQGNDTGTQYRSAAYFNSPSQESSLAAITEMFQQRLTDAGKGEITTEIKPAGEFFYAEDYHQQYLHKNPNGYCGIGGVGVTCPIGTLS